MESFKRVLENIGRMWANLTATQRVMLSAACAAMVLLLIFSSVGTTQAWVRVAGPEVEATIRANIVKKLQERHQKHEVRGSEIVVPKEDADRIILELAGEGTVNKNEVYEFLKQSDIFAPRWNQEKRLQIALQTRLEGIIRSIESVRNAAVVINPGSTHHQLGFAGPKPSASVQVELREGMELTRKNVKAIAGFVARAVSGVEEDQVHIMDTKGNPYRAAKPESTGSSMDIRDFERTQEKSIQEKIKEGLGYPGAAVVVTVQANSRSSKSEELKHDRPVVIETTDHKRTVKKGTGAPSGVRKGEGESPVEPSSGVDEVESQSTERSVVGSKKIIEDAPAGDIQRITVAVRIPVEDGAPLADARRQLPDLREFVRVAAGPQARAEDISVQVFPTKKPEAIAMPSESGQTLVRLWSHWPKVVLGVLVLAGFFVIVRVIQGSAAQDTVEELQALTTALTETQEGAAGLAVPAEGDLGRLRQGIQDMVGKNAPGVAASLKSFMSGR